MMMEVPYVQQTFVVLVFLFLVFSPPPMLSTGYSQPLAQGNAIDSSALNVFILFDFI